MSGGRPAQPFGGDHDASEWTGTPADAALDADSAEDLSEFAEGSLLDESNVEAETPLATALRERDEYLDALRRMHADFDNYRKRVQRDSELSVERATEKIVTKLLPVLDHFEMALGHSDDPDQSLLAKVHDTLLTLLEGEGLERTYPLGEPFDPVDADAVAHEPGDGSGPIVASVLRAGYRWKGRVVRAAMVRVVG